jgi:phage terminase Nu1 subunit (DNA packaging protein)
LAAQLTSEERLERLDREVEELKELFVDALEQLRLSPEADASVQERWQTIADRIRGLRAGVLPEDYDKDQLAMLVTSLLDMRDLLDRQSAPGDLDVCDGLLIALERIRHVVRDALDEHVNGVGDDVGLVMTDLGRWLPNIPDRTIAELVGVDRRTLSRWRKQGGPPRRQLRIFARLVAILRHNWDEEGVIAWFGRPRRDLDGKRPRALLGDPNAEAELVNGARSGRSQYAT